jgi:hypothetical protein
MNWDTVAPGLVSLVRMLAAPDPLTPLPDGTVSWYNRDLPFIGPDTQVGIYMRVLQYKGYGKDRTTKTYPAGATGGVVQFLLQAQKKLTLQIQAKSLESTDTTWCLQWLTNITTRMWDPTVREAFLALDLSLIRIGYIQQQELVQDDHMASYGSVDLEFTYAQNMLGLPVGTIEHATVTGGPSD